MMSYVKQVAIHDDLISEQTLERVQEFFSENVRWKYGWKQGGADPFSHWNTDFLHVSARNQENMEHRLSESAELSPILELWNALKNGPFRGHHLVRCYANGHTFGIDGHPHTDISGPHEVDNYTAVVYINPIWKSEWAGELVFLDDIGDVCLSVLPQPGRIAIFPGSMVHAARGVARSCPALRVSVAYKVKWPRTDT